MKGRKGVGKGTGREREKRREEIITGGRKNSFLCRADILALYLGSPTCVSFSTELPRKHYRVLR